MTRIIGTDPDLPGQPPESPDSGKRQAEAAPKDPIVRELVAHFEKQARLAGSPAAEVDSQGDSDSRQEGDHDLGSEPTGEDSEGSPEQQWLGAFKARFDALPELHPDVEWAEVEKSLMADPEAMRKLQVLDEVGFEMNVFRSKNDGEIQFRTAQTDVTKIDPKYRTIVYDKEAQKEVEKYPAYRDSMNGNAEKFVEDIGIELADPELYEQLRVKKGSLWLKTDAATREIGKAFDGSYEVAERMVHSRYNNTSFCAALRVKKA